MRRIIETVRCYFAWREVGYPPIKAARLAWYLSAYNTPEF